MCDCQNGKPMVDPLIPQMAVITAIRKDTHDVATFRVNKPGGGKNFDFKPGQCAMLTLPGTGEAIFSITSSPTNRDFMEFSVKRCGTVTDHLHQVEPGQQVGLRGPYGNAFDVEGELRGKDLLFIAGGIGLAPLRSVINYVLDNRANYGKVDIVYGVRSKDDFVHAAELTERWPKLENVDVHLTIDRAQEGWSGNVGFVPQFVKDLNFGTNKTVLVCGPPIMIKFVLKVLTEIGFDKKQVYTTLELKMKCGFGKCGRCNIGDKYVCRDGPVFRCDELDEMPDEY
jgi:NAD(P)H-flavin reductase